MDIRRVQRTGKMHYVYLPTSWCKRYKINSDTKIAITENADGALLITPDAPERKEKKIDLTLPSKYKEVLINLIMACYVNPTSSFRIKLDKKINMASILDQKALFSALEFVELDGEHITYEASMTVHEPDRLLCTMVKKIRNLMHIMVEGRHRELVEKYEEEIDRSKILIQKSVISALVLNESTKMRAIDMYYTVQLATELERIVDAAIRMRQVDLPYLRQVLTIIEGLKELLEETERLDYLSGTAFAKRALSLPESEDFNKFRIKKLFQAVVELILDWSITKELQK